MPGVIAWVKVLRGINPLEHVEKYVASGELAGLSRHNNKPLALLQANTLQITELKEKGQIDIFGQVQINNTLVNFSNAMGMAERIKILFSPSTYRMFFAFFYLHIRYYTLYRVKGYQKLF